MVAGLEDISEGELLIDGKLVNDVPPKDRDIAMVFQNYALYPHMSVYDNMAFGLKIRKLPKEEIDQRVKEARGFWTSRSSWTANPNSSPAASASGGRGRAIVRKPKSSSSTSLCPTWTPS
jgi:multiple sugar transport system ATP-binding protein